MYVEDNSGGSGSFEILSWLYRQERCIWSVWQSINIYSFETSGYMVEFLAKSLMVWDTIWYRCGLLRDGLSQSEPGVNDPISRPREQWQNCGAGSYRETGYLKSGQICCQSLHENNGRVPKPLWQLSNSPKSVHGLGPQNVRWWPHCWRHVDLARGD